MKENRFLLISLFVTAAILFIVCVAAACLTVLDRPDSSPVIETYEREESAVLSDTAETTEQETFAYENYDAISDWYEGIIKDPLSDEKLYFASVEEYLEISDAAQQGDLTVIEQYWSKEYRELSFSSSHEMLTYFRQVFRVFDAIPLVWPTEEWEVTGIRIFPRTEMITVAYRNPSSSGEKIESRGYARVMKWVAGDELYATPIDGAAFRFYDYADYSYDFVQIGFFVSDTVYSAVELSFDAGQSDVGSWYFCTARGYAERDSRQ